MLYNMGMFLMSFSNVGTIFSIKMKQQHVYISYIMYQVMLGQD